MGAKFIYGGANNKLQSPVHDAALAARGIVYMPDFLVNAGTVIDFDQERIDDTPAAVLAAVARTGVITGDILTHAAASG